MRLSIKKFDTEEDLLDLKRKFFTQARDKIITNFSDKWFVSVKKSAIQYRLGIDRIPNTRGIVESKDYERYKVKYSGINPFKRAQEMEKN